jgi:hypothetical protein
MAKMRTAEEAKAAFNQLPKEQQEQMKSECQTTTSDHGDVEVLNSCN